PMSCRLLLAMAALFVAPFLTQKPAYILGQYQAFLQNTITASHVGSVEKGWTTMFNALTVIGINIAERSQTVIRLVAAVGTLALCVIARRGQAAERSAIFVYSLAAAYLMLFSPRTENNTYAMFAPVVGLFLSSAYMIEKRMVPAVLLSAVAFILVIDRNIERLLTPLAGTSWVSPLMAVCVTGYLIVTLFERREQQTVSTAASGRA
ncbi:MAG TPA: hypothetical protein VIX18_08715, partial [Nitrospirota bacterium]